jgi:thiosulfate reductase / polysulfide reductase chain A
MGDAFFNLFGSPNLCGANNICMCPSVAVEYATYRGFATGDRTRTRCLAVWGNATSQSDPLLGFPEIAAAKKRGAKLIVVDPRRTREAQLADFWLPIRPGTDARVHRPRDNYALEDNVGVCVRFSSPRTPRG